MAKSIVWIWTAVFVASVGQAGMRFHRGAGFAILDVGERAELELEKILCSCGSRRYLEPEWAAVVSPRKIMGREGAPEKKLQKTHMQRGTDRERGVSWWGPGE